MLKPIHLMRCGKVRELGQKLEHPIREPAVVLLGGPDSQRTIVRRFVRPPSVAYLRDRTGVVSKPPGPFSRGQDGREIGESGRAIARLPTKRVSGVVHASFIIRHGIQHREPAWDY